MMRGFLALFWRIRGWDYRRRARAQNRHAASVNERIAELTQKARDAERRAAALMAATRSGGAS